MAMRTRSRYGASSSAQRWNPPYFETEVELSPGDALVFYTDGVLEARAPKRILEGIDVARAAQEGAGAGPAAIAEAVTRLTDDTSGNPPRDDVAILVVQAIA